MTRIVTRTDRPAHRAPEVSVLGTVSTGRHHRVDLVWHHRAWCPMTCKVFQSARRCRREGDVLRALDHPNVVRFLGRATPHSLLMEYLEGPTLAQLLRRGSHRRLSASDAVRAAIHIGAALAHVHARGFLHLDVKPSNVIAARGRPVLFDFEIARRPTSRRSDVIEGTEAYMAPEQCDGGPLTAATDVFGLGAMLYELLTGRLPYPPGDRRCRYPQTALPPASVRDYVSSVPRGLEHLVHACLARDPADRPSLDTLLPELHAYIGSGPRMWPEGFSPSRTRNGARPTRHPLGKGHVAA